MREVVQEYKTKSCEALICCGRGGGFEPTQFNSIQSNSIQFNSKGTQLTVMQQSLPSSLPSQQQHALMAFLQHVAQHLHMLQHFQVWRRSALLALAV